VEWGERELLVTTRIFKLDKKKTFCQKMAVENRAQTEEQVAKYSTISKMYRKEKRETEQDRLKELNKKRQKEMKNKGKKYF